ncbi:MAG: YceI family protein [Myxococcota bacterium]|nr:YceI family protein [Myxococcota bacterium]
MKIRSMLGTLVVLLTMSAPTLVMAEDQESTGWTLSQRDSLLQVTTGTEGLLAGLAHSHTIVAEAFTGQVEYDPAAPSKMRIDVALQSASLKVIDRDVDEATRNQIQANMVEILQPEQHPTMRFVSDKVKVVEGGIQASGVMTICGKQKSLTIDLQVVKSGAGHRVTTEFSLNHSDFGLEPYSAALGTIRVADALTFTIDAQLVRP